MLKKPTYKGLEEILSGFKSLNPDGKFYFSLWHGEKDIAMQCTETGLDYQTEMLEPYLESLEKAGNSELMYLKLHPPVEGYINAKTPVISNTPIQVVEFTDVKILSGETTISRPAGMSYEAWEMMKNLRDLPATISGIVDERLKTLLPDEEEDEEPEEDQVTKYIGIIKGVTQDPTIMALIGQVINFLKPQGQPYASPGRIGMMTEQQNNPYQQPVAMADEKQPIATNEDVMNEALNRLQYHCDLGDCLRRLANMADANPAGFQQLLTMLPQ
jgi:hypothetical protein